MADPTKMRADVLELLARARNYRDKPHQLYSHIAVMGDRYLDDGEARREVRNTMDAEYLRRRGR